MARDTAASSTDYSAQSSAGESVGGVRRVQPAAEIVRELADGAERLLGRWTQPALESQRV